MNSTDVSILGDFAFAPSPLATILPVLSFMSMVLDGSCLAWHVKNRNLPAACLVFWIMLDNLFNFVNALIWPTDDIASWWLGYGYCDVEVKLDLASALGTVGALACVMRSLARALDTEKGIMGATHAQRQRQWMVEMLLCFGLPVYMIVIHYVVQPSRYYIFAITGCTPSFDDSWPSIVLVYIWPMIFCLVDAFYCGKPPFLGYAPAPPFLLSTVLIVLVIHRLAKHHHRLTHVLRHTSRTLTPSRFLRLFSIALVLLLVFLPCQVYVLYRNLSFPLEAYSWDLVHAETLTQIYTIPTFGAVAFDRWICVAAGYSVFLCFGLGREARALYASWLCALGLARLFPRLKPGYAASGSDAAGGPDIGPAARRLGGAAGTPSSFGSRARLFFQRRSASASASAWGWSGTGEWAGDRSTLGRESVRAAAAEKHGSWVGGGVWGLGAGLSRAWARLRRGETGTGAGRDVEQVEPSSTGTLAVGAEETKV
jgi:pheromone a factor receptor